MQDMSAFEQQLAAELGQMAGAGRRIDSTAMVAAVSTRSPRWRFQSMFSATKFVIAGVIVALFGGVLLAGALAPPSDERLPAVGASATGELSSEPTITVSHEPATTRSDILQNVDLEIEEVGVGIFRLLSDGSHDLQENVWDVTVSSAGDVWLEKHAIVGYSGTGDQRVEGHDPGRAVVRNSRVFRLGEPGVSFRHDDSISLSLVNGQPALSLKPRGSRYFDGERWVPGDRGETRPPCTGSRSALDATGACLRVLEQGDVVRVDARGGEQRFSPQDLGLDEDQYLGLRWATGPDGKLWTSVGRWVSYGEGRVTGLASFDGERWSTVERPGERTGVQATQLAVDADGDVWAIIVRTAEDGLQEDWIERWDGDGWETFGPIDFATRPTMRSTDDGTLWFDPLTFFDGEMVRQLELPSSPENARPEIHAHAFAPDGSVWIVVADRTPSEEARCGVLGPRKTHCAGVTDGLYVIARDAIAASD